MPALRKKQTVDQYLTVSAAAELVGVTPTTLRNWDRTDKLRALRHPLNGYRLYRREELETILAQIAQSASPRLKGGRGAKKYGQASSGMRLSGRGR